MFRKSQKPKKLQYDRTGHENLAHISALKKEESKPEENEFWTSVTLSSQLSSAVQYIGNVQALDDEDSDGVVLILREEGTRDAAQLDKLVEVLKDWLNNALRKRRIVIRDLFDDLSDGRVLIEFFEEVTNGEPSLTRNEMLSLNEKGRRRKLSTLIRLAELVLPPNYPRRWPMDALVARDPVALLHLVVAFAFVFPEGPELPNNVCVRAIRASQASGILMKSEFRAYVTSSSTFSAAFDPELSSIYCDVMVDNFAREVDDVFRAGPQAVNRKIEELLAWVNKHLPVQHQVKNFEHLSMGVYFIYLACQQGGYFLVTKMYYPKGVMVMKPEQKEHNFNIALDLLTEDGMPIPTSNLCEIKDLAEGDKKALMYFMTLVREHFDNKE